MAYLQRALTDDEHGMVGYRRGCHCDVCKAANTAQHLAYYRANLEQERARQREWDRAKEGREPGRRRRLNRRNALMRRYGLTPETWDALIVSQSGRCAACSDPLNPSTRGDGRPVVDHDHTTGVVRGILCVHCNSALGLVRDDEGRLLALVAYLRVRESARVPMRFGA